MPRRAIRNRQPRAAARDRRRLFRAARTLSILAVAAPIVQGCDFIRGYASGPSDAMVEIEAAAPDSVQRGQLRFLFDDLNGLNTDTLQTNALPWKLAVAALLLYETRDEPDRLDIDGLEPLLQRYGFFVPQNIANWDAPGPAPRLDQPLGIVTGIAARRLPAIELEVANLGCAACHAGVLYDAQGRPHDTAWLGLPNTSINLEGYTQRVYRSLQYAASDPAALLAAVDRLFPEIAPAERRTLRSYVLPRMSERLALLAQTIDAPAPFSNGGPGLTNGVGALKLQLGLLAPDRRSAEYGFTSIPDLGGVLLRSSLLYDGAYSARGAERFAARAIMPAADVHLGEAASITTFFTIPTMGVHPSAAARSIPRVEEIFRFIAGYEPPPFPGPIDAELAARGRALYEAHCAACHGEFSAAGAPLRLVGFPNRLSALEDIGSDAARARAIDPALIDALAATRFADHVVAQGNAGYVAPRLTGLWATAPYLHNGSVPTLWHLLNPAARPQAFYTGGHRLDFERVGIAGDSDDTGTFRYPPGYLPWSEPVLVDTNAPGMSNRGHEREFLAVGEPDEQRALLEFLKRL